MTSSRIPDPPPKRAPEGGGPARHPRPSGRRILFFSFLASAFIHLIVIVIYPLLTDAPSEPPAQETANPEDPQDALRVLTLEPIESPEEPEAAVEPATDPEEEEEADEEPAETELPEVTRPPLVAPPETGVEERAPTVAERLQPRMGDPRLWREVLPEAGEMTDEERARMRVYGILREWSDSVAALEEAERRALDWTYTDDEGRRWGVSPGRIHLGDFSLPLPIHFATPAGIRDAVERRNWEWAEIERGAASAAVREALQERAREIRRRRDSERADTIPRGR